MTSLNSKKKVAVIQPNYIPWKGYFDIINSVDIFVLYDDVQYTRRDWRNRNKIKTPQGLSWLTVPVKAKGTYSKARINEIYIDGMKWREKHWKAIKLNYAKAKFFNTYKDFFEHLYMDEYLPGKLSEINKIFIEKINKILNIKTPIVFSSTFEITGSKSERLLQLCKKLDAGIYLSGPSAKVYLDEQLFNEHGIKVEWMDYNGYPEYPQLYPPFVHEVSIIDLILNTGHNAKMYMKSFGKYKSI